MTVAEKAKLLKRAARDLDITAKEFSANTVYTMQQFNKQMNGPVSNMTLGFLTSLERVIDSRKA